MVKEKTLYRWNIRKDEWEFITTATLDKLKVVLRGYKRRDVKGVKWRWTEGTPPKKFRTREKQELPGAAEMEQAFVKNLLLQGYIEVHPGHWVHPVTKVEVSN